MQHQNLQGLNKSYIITPKNIQYHLLDLICPMERHHVLAIATYLKDFQLAVFIEKIFQCTFEKKYFPVNTKSKKNFIEPPVISTYINQEFLMQNPNEEAVCSKILLLQNQIDTQIFIYKKLKSLPYFLILDPLMIQNNMDDYLNKLKSNPEILLIKEMDNEGKENIIKNLLILCKS